MKCRARRAADGARVALTLLLLGCGTDSFAPPDGGDANQGDGTFDAPKDCDTAKDPKDSPACVVDSVGVFVSPMGSDGAPGTRAMPVQTIAKGFDLAKMKGLPRVYVCAGTYGALTLDDKRDGVSAFGGFDCAGWMPGSAPTLVKSNDNKPSLTATNLTAGVSLVDLQFQSQDASEWGAWRMPSQWVRPIRSRRARPGWTRSSRRWPTWGIRQSR